MAGVISPDQSMMRAQTAGQRTMIIAMMYAHTARPNVTCHNHLYTGTPDTPMSYFASEPQNGHCNVDRPFKGC